MGSTVLTNEHSQSAILRLEQPTTDSGESGGTWRKGTERKRFVITVVAIGLAGFFAFGQIAKWPERLRYPGEEDAAEGTQLSEMVHLRRGIDIYRMPSDGDFDGAIYGPLCYLLGAAMINPDHPTYFPLRLLSLAATLGLVTVAGVFTYKLTRQRLAGVLTALLLLSSAYVGRYGVSARADMLALLLVFSGFVLFYTHRQSRLALGFSCGLILLGFFYKQQFIGAPIAIFFFLIAEQPWRRVAEFILMMLGGGILLFALFSLAIFPHGAFLTHFVSYNRLPFDKTRVMPEILMFAIPLFVPLLAGADFLDQYPDKLAFAYGSVAAGAYFLLLFSSGSGADTNRCLEAVVILTCLLAARIATLDRLISGLSWNAAMVLTVAMVALLGSAFVVPWVTPNDLAADRTVQNYLRENFSPGTSALTYYAGDPIRAGLETPITNLWHYTALIRKGVISDRDVVSRISRGGYGVILLDFNITNSETRKMDFYTTQSMRAAIMHSYEEKTRLTLPSPELTRYNDRIIHVLTPRSVAGLEADR